MDKKLQDAILKIKKYIDQHEDEFVQRLKQFVGYIYTNSTLIRQKGYCGVFNIPYETIANFYKKKLGFSDQELKELGVILFQIGHPSDIIKSAKTGTEKKATETMYADPYYVFNILLIISLIEKYKETNDKKYLSLAQIPVFLIQTKLWNGRIKEYFVRGCNPEVMLCVIKKLTKKSLVKHFDNPLELISRYFTPTVFAKYIKECHLLEKRDLIDCVQRLFKQSWNRIKQIFSTSNRGSDDESFRFGLAIRYYKAIESGECKTAQGNTEDEELTILQMKTTDVVVSELAEKIKHFIMITEINEIPEEIFNLIYKKTKIRKELLRRLPEKIKDPEIVVMLDDVIAIMLRRLELHRRRNIICSPQFYIYVDKMIQSKNNQEINYYKEILAEIAKNFVGKERFESVSDVTKIMLLRAINYIIAFYVQEYICNHYEEEI